MTSILSFVKQRIRQSSLRFVTECSGASSLLFAVAAPSLLGLLGGAVDYASLANQGTKMRALADATALSVGRQMTMTKLTDSQIDAVAKTFAAGNAAGQGLVDLQVQASVSADRLAVSVKVVARAKTTLGLLPRLAGIDMLDASATARVGQQTKLCLLSVSEARSNEIKGGMFYSTEQTGIDIGINARLTAPGCLLHTNIKTREAFTVNQGATVTADLLCAAGGVLNRGGAVEAAVVDSCPKILNPMDTRYYPNLNQGCTSSQYKDIIIDKGTHVLSPGNYCGNIVISGDAKVRLSGGNYAIQGTLVVTGSAELSGQGVGLYLWGGKASTLMPAGFAFLENSLIDLSAPESGQMAGILIWEGINGAAFDQAGQLAGGNYHQINTMRARRLTGTLYLPGGRLLIDAPAKVAEDSDYTVLLVNRLDLAEGPNLVLNSNYAKSRVPVPPGLGPLGAKNVRLTQ